jgi:hypothetical protein
MPKRIFITFLFATALAFVALFAATEVWAEDIFGDEYLGDVGRDYKYFQYNGFKFEFVGCTYDKADDKSTCTWEVTQQGDKTISHFLVTLRPDLAGRIVDHGCDNPDDCNIKVILDGSGDPSTKAFGRFLGLALIKFSRPQEPEFPWGSPVQASLTFDGRVGTEIVAAFVKSGPCAYDNPDVVCPDSSFGPVKGVGEFSEETISGIGSTGGCISVADIAEGTIYMGYEREANGCDVKQNSLRLYINSPDCKATTLCDDITDPSRYQTGCDCGEPEDCTPTGCDDKNLEDCPTGFCIDAALLAELKCAQPGSNCPECIEVESGSPTCLKYTTASGTVIKSCFLDDGTTCPWRKCCKLGREVDACGY